MRTHFDYEKRTLLNKLEKELKDTEETLKYLKDVKRKKKKDWTDFKNFLQNFEGWWIRFDDYKSELLQYIYIWYGEGRSFIELSTVDDKFVAEHPDRAVKRYWLKDCVYYTPDEMRELIQKRVEREELRLQAIDSNIRDLDKIRDGLIVNIKPLIGYLEQFEWEGWFNNEPIYYPMRDIIQVMF